MIEESVARIRSRIASACSRSGRDPEGVTIVAVTKGRPASSIREALAAGLVDIGENRVQEAREKFAQLGDASPDGMPGAQACVWHLIGHLQTNKVKDAVRIFGMIHSVDSLRLAQEIDKQAGIQGKVQECLVEVKVSADPLKTGVPAEEAQELVRRIAALGHVRVRGLMCVAPLVDDAEQARPYFRMLRELQAKLNSQAATPEPLTVLSMGMTDDFEVAVEEGATMVRLGRALFG